MYCKKIVAFIILLICCYTAMAQRRSCDMEVFCVSPSGKVANNGQLPLRFGFVNRGPDVMYSNDTAIYTAYVVVNGEANEVYTGGMSGNPGRVINIGEQIMYMDNYGIRFPYANLTDTLIVDFCVFVSPMAIAQNGDTLRFSYDDPNLENNRACNKVMVLPQRSTAITNTSEENSRLSVYPNPAKDEINIVSDSEKEHTLIITDMRGVTVKKLTVHAGHNTSDIRSLPDGMYLIYDADRDSKTVQRLTIMHN